MNFHEALAYLSSLSRFGSVLTLDRIRALCERCHHPEKGLRALHVGGTKGKGSVTMMLSHILHEAGRCVGTFVKPHLYDVRERVLVNLQPISEADFAALMTEIRPHLEAVASAGLGHPTEFEAKTLLMLLHFSRLPVDVAVIEVGLGGTYDSTNVILPQVAVITNVSLDHVERLGYTIPEIATQKAGIIKPGRPVITAARHPEALSVIERTAAAQEAPLWRIGREFTAVRTAYDAQGQHFHVRTPVQEHRDLFIPMTGEFQVENAATAVATLDMLGTLGHGVCPEAVRVGLSRAKVMGRMEILRHSPLVLIDGAHNAASAEALAAALRELYSDRRLILVLGISQDHSAADVVGALAPHAAVVIATAANNARALPATEVAAAAQHYAPQVEAVPSVPEAVRRALDLASPKDCICITGSFYVIGEVDRDMVVEKAP